LIEAELKEGFKRACFIFVVKFLAGIKEETG